MVPYGIPIKRQIMTWTTIPRCICVRWFQFWIPNCHLYYTIAVINPFSTDVPLVYPLKTSENWRFWCFQGVYISNIGLKWVNLIFENRVQCKYELPQMQPNPANIYLFKVNDTNIRKSCEICSKLTISKPEQCHWRRSDVFLLNFEHISSLF